MVKQSKLLKGGRHYKTTRKVVSTALFFLFLVILSSIAVSATTDWPQYQRWNFKGGAQDTTYYSEWNGTSTYSELAFGNNYQPIASDWDNDSVMELIGSQNNVLYIYTLSSTGVLTLENSFNMGATQDSQGYMFDNVSNKLLMIGFGTTMYSLRYNGSSLDKSINATLNNASISGITCITLGGGQGCYWIAGSNLTESNPLDLSTMTQTTNFSAYTFSTDAPTMIDSDQDGDYEIITMMKVGGANQYLGVIDRATLALDTTFSTDGLLSLSATNMGNPHVISYNLVQGFGTEICALYQTHPGANPVMIECVDYAGNSLLSATIQADAFAGDPVIGTIFLADVDGVDGFDVCAYGVSEAGGSHINTISCWNGWDGSLDLVFTESFPDTYFGAGIADIMTSADMDNDGKDDFLAGNYIFYSNGSTSNTNTTISAMLNIASNIIPVDISGDDILDVCGQYTSETFCATTNVAVNVIPTLTNSLLKSYGNPVCNGSTVRFTGKEYDEVIGRTVTADDYYNDGATDQEKLVADCYGNTSLTNGSLSLAAPYVECTYNAPNTYYAKVYLLDDHNTGDYTQYQSFTIQVIAGIPGSTCGTEVDVLSDDDGIADTDLSGATPSEIDQGWTALFGWLTAGNSSAKLLIGFMLFLMLVVGVAVGLARLGVSGSALSVLVMLVSGLGFILLTIIGLFPVWILVLLLLVLALITGLVLALKATGG